MPPLPYSAAQAPLAAQPLVQPIVNPFAPGAGRLPPVPAPAFGQQGLAGFGQQPVLPAPGVMGASTTAPRLDAVVITSDLAKYTGNNRTADHKRYIQALADKVLGKDQIGAHLLQLLNALRSVGRGEAFTDLRQVQFTGAEAQLIQQAVASGTYSHIKDSPIQAFYEYVFTVDDFVDQVMSTGSYCIKHLLAVRMSNNVPGINTPEVDANDFLKPQRMSEETIAQMKAQIPPPDFCLWEVRDLAKRFESQRYDAIASAKPLDKFTGFYGLLNPESKVNKVYIKAPADYKTKMAPLDQDKYKDQEAGNWQQQVRSKTMYQQCLDEAVGLGFEFVNTHTALSQGLFRIHFLSEMRLQAPSVAGAVAIAYNMLMGDSKEYPVNALTGELSLREGKTDAEKDLLAQVKTFHEKAKKIIDSTSATGGVPLSKMDWINAFAHANFSPLLWGTGLLQPKPSQWNAYASNYVRKLFRVLAGDAEPLPATVERPAIGVQVLRSNGGAIGRLISVHSTPVYASPKDNDPAKFNVVDKPEDYVKRLGTVRDAWYSVYSRPERLDIDKSKELDVAITPYPNTDEVAVGYGEVIAAELSEQDDLDAKSLRVGVVIDATKELVELVCNPAKYDRTRALRVADGILRDRMRKAAPAHAIRFCADIAEAVEATRFGKWLEQNYLHPLIRVFHEVVLEGESTPSQPCLQEFEPWPVIQMPDGTVKHVPLSQAGFVDPISGRFVFSQTLDQLKSRCVVPGTGGPVEPVAGVTNLVQGGGLPQPTPQGLAAPQAPKPAVAEQQQPGGVAPAGQPVK